MKKVQYAIWEVESDGNGYWCLFDSITDAVSGQEKGVEVYRFEAKHLGRFKRSAVTVRMKRKRSRAASRKSK